MKEQTGAGTDVRSRLDVRFGLEPVEKDLDRLPQGTDMRGHGIFGKTKVSYFFRFLGVMSEMFRSACRCAFHSASI